MALIRCIWLTYPHDLKEAQELPLFTLPTPMSLRHLYRSVNLAYFRPSIVQARLNPRLSTSIRPHSKTVSRRRRDQLSQVLESNSSSIVLALVVAVSLTAGGSYYIRERSSIETQLERSIALDKRIVAQTLEDMPDAIPPGRPGSLTSEQEAKLKELWVSVLRVFGVTSATDGVNGSKSLEEADQRSKADPNGSVREKKKRVSLFRKKDKTDDSEGALTDSSTDANDKWGQTKQFHNALANQSPEDLRKAHWNMVKHDHPDGLLLRFLRARKWDVQNALVMMVATMHWRLQEMHVDDDIMKKGEGGALEDSQSTNAAVKKEGLDFLAQERLGKSFIHGTDKEGRPMCFVRVRLHKQGQQSETSLERYTVFVIETARLMLSPPVDTAAIVFDMTDFSMANMDYSPVKFMIKVFEANYPESLGVVLVHKSPWIFQSIWNIIKGWLDPVVASKVHFTKTVEELEAYVEKSHIIKELGGSDPWQYQFVEPKPGENDQMKDETTKQRLLDERAIVVKEFETATQDWVKDSQTSQQQRTKLAEQLRSGYWQLDPYLRARSLYDRTGLIQKDGKIQHYPTPAMNGPLPAQHRLDDLD